MPPAKKGYGSLHRSMKVMILTKLGVPQICTIYLHSATSCSLKCPLDKSVTIHWWRSPNKADAEEYMFWLENGAFLWGSPRWCLRRQLRWDPTNSMHKWITIVLMECQNLTYMLQILLSFWEEILCLSVIYLILKILSNSKSLLLHLPSLRFLSTCTIVLYFHCPLRIPATIEYIVLSRGAGKASMWA